MLRRELKINLKAFLIWLSVLILLFLVVFLIYPSIVSSNNVEMLNEVMEMFPEDVLRAFNMDISSIDTAYGWLKTEGFIMILLVTGIYSSVLGSSILLKEENDKTIEYLNSLPVRREDILKDKIICSLVYIILMVLIIGLFNYVALCISGDFDKKQYLLLSITPLFSSISLFSINLYVSTYFSKLKNAIAVSLGISLISYFIQVISELSREVEFFKYFTVFTLADIRNVILNNSINPIMVFISIFVSLIFMMLSYFRYNEKELI